MDDRIPVCPQPGSLCALRLVRASRYAKTDWYVANAAASAPELTGHVEGGACQVEEFFVLDAGRAFGP